MSLACMAEFDRNALWPGIEEDFADKINAKVSSAVFDARKEERQKHEAEEATLKLRNSTLESRNSTLETKNMTLESENRKLRELLAAKK